MQFRSGRFWSRTGSKALAFSLLGSLFGLLACSPVSFAYVTLLQVGGPAGTVIGSTYYFPADNPPNVPAPTATMVPNSTPINFGSYQYTSGNYPIFNVSWTPTGTTPPTSPTGFMLVVTMAGSITGNSSGSGQVVASPPGACPGNNSSCIIVSPTAIVSSSGGTSGTVTNSYYASYSIQPYTQVQVALDFRVLCDSFAKLNNSGVGSGCGGNGINSMIVNPPSGTSGYTTLTLTFGIYPVPNPIPATEPTYNYSSPPSAVDSSGPLTFNFSNAPSTGSFTCNLSNAYYPGDGQITVDGTAFSYSGTTNPPDGLANSYMMVVKEAEGTPPLSFTQINPTAANFVSGKDTGGTGDPYVMLSSVPVIPGNIYGGFKNSTATDAVYYGVGFIGQDYYQFLLPTSGAGCAYSSEVQTASLNTLLNSSKCFIATATFRSADSPPLILLRAFRDQFLEHFGLGKAFVHWYYAWSPGAADWLIANPVFRFPIFLALIPLQLVAWLVLHPLTLTLLMMLALSLLTYGVSLRVRRE